MIWVPYEVFSIILTAVFFLISFIKSKEIPGTGQKEWKEPEDLLFNILVVRKASNMSLHALESSEPNNLLVTSTDVCFT